MLGLVRYRQSWRDITEQMGHGLVVIDWGVARPMSSHASLWPDIFSNKATPFLWEWGRHLSKEGLRACFRKSSENPS